MNPLTARLWMSARQWAWLEAASAGKERPSMKAREMKELVDHGMARYAPPNRYAITSTGRLVITGQGKMKAIELPEPRLGPKQVTEAAQRPRR